MAVVERKTLAGEARRYVVYRWHGRQVWELCEGSARDAQRLDERRKREIAAGTYVPPKQRRVTTVGEWIESWVEQREGRNADNERQVLERLVLTRSWFTAMRLDAVQPPDLKRLVDELRTTVSDATGKPLSTKYVANIYGNIRTAFRDARYHQVIDSDPCVLPRGTLKRTGRSRRDIYALGEIDRLTADERVAPDMRVFNALAFYTGMREGEICGRRWRDYDTATEPLGALTVDSQYDGQPLKTAKQDGEQPRVVPVHPELAAILAWWHRDGFELVHCRKPTRDDFIVPTRAGHGHTRSTAYKAWRRACAAAEVDNRSLHSTRHTFITQARRGGARADVLERVTHNASGAIIDRYTHWEWAPLCESVLCLPVRRGVDATANGPSLNGGGAGNRSQGQSRNDGERPETKRNSDRADRSANSGETVGANADVRAIQQAGAIGLASVRLEVDGREFGRAGAVDGDTSEDVVERLVDAVSKRAPVGVRKAVGGLLVTRRASGGAR